MCRADSETHWCRVEHLGQHPQMFPYATLLCWKPPGILCLVYSVESLHTHITEGEPKCMWSAFCMKHQSHKVCHLCLGNIWTSPFFSEGSALILGFIDMSVDLLISINTLYANLSLLSPLWMALLACYGIFNVLFVLTLWEFHTCISSNLIIFTLLLPKIHQDHSRQLSSLPTSHPLLLK